MILGIRTELDSVLSVVAPIGLAAAGKGAVLVVDLDQTGPAYPGERTLAELVEEGPRRSELSPPSAGVATLANGGVDWQDTLGVIEALAAGWSAVVTRVVGSITPPWPVIPVVPLLPGILAPLPGRAAVWQATSVGGDPPGPGPVLPPLSRVTLTSLLKMHAEPGGRWVKAWRPIWELRWE